MSIEKAIDILRMKYEQAKKKEHIKYPLSWAFYYTWRDVYDTEKGRKEQKNDYQQKEI